MEKSNLSIIVRASDDNRVFELLETIDYKCEIIITITPNKEMETKLDKLFFKYIVTPKGNPSKTLIEGINLSKNDKILIIDSDCLFYKGAIERLLEISNKYDADIVKSNIVFEYDNFSSYLTKLVRNLQYDFSNYIYGPGLLINRKKLLPKVGNYLFNELCPYTDDGELDFRIRKSNSDFVIIKDDKKTLIHRKLSFYNHIKGYYKYGYSDACRIVYLNQNVLSLYLSTTPKKYFKGFFKYSMIIPFILFISDITYILSLTKNYILLKNKNLIHNN